MDRDVEQALAAAPVDANKLLHDVVVSQTARSIETYATDSKL
jgi:hypothetical protein